MLAGNRELRTFSTADSQNKQNLAVANVITASDLDAPGQGRDWIKERWQAAKDLSGAPIPGPHWVEVDLQTPIDVKRVAIHFEAACESRKGWGGVGWGRVGGESD